MRAKADNTETKSSHRVPPWPDGAAFVRDQSGARIVPVEEAKISLLDWGFARSDVTYDVVHVWDGSFFRLADHLDRFFSSCRKLRLDPGVDREQLTDILAACVRHSGLQHAYVDMICTRGQPTPGSRDPRNCNNQLFAYAVPFVWVLSPEVQARGGHLCISERVRIPPQSIDPTVKNFHWGDLTYALFEALDEGADTVVLRDLEGNIAEGPGFNVFAVADRRVLSPRGTVLEGITRQTVRELCDALDIPFELTQLSAQALRDADEVFLSSTAGGIMPISRVDQRILSNDRPGELTTQLRDLYWSRHSQGWYATPIDYNLELISDV